MPLRSIKPTNRSIRLSVTFSPILANIYLHYVLDVWFEETVRAHCTGHAYLCRYADDFVCAFQHDKDAQRFYQAIPHMGFVWVQGRSFVINPLLS